MHDVVKKTAMQSQGIPGFTPSRQVLLQVQQAQAQAQALNGEKLAIIGRSQLFQARASHPISHLQAACTGDG